MNFLQPGDRLTAARWNDLFAQADALLTSALGGLSAVFVGADKQWDRGFFFGFDPVNPPNTLHLIALKFIKSYQSQVPVFQPGMFWRQYNHGAITGQLSGLSQLSSTTKWNVVKLALPTWSAWSAAVYPSGFGSISSPGLTQSISSTLYAVNNCLDASLQVHKASVSGTPFNVTFSNVLQAEHAQPLKPIDVFILGGFSWDTSNWDKYSVVRVHNCGKTAATATFGSVSATLAPGACKCFRKLATGWIVCLNYFHTMQSGDGRFLQMRETAFPDGHTPGGTASIFMPGIVTDVLGNVLMGSATNFGGQFDCTKFFDMSPVYNNPAYAKLTPGENTPPAAGYFPQLASAPLLGDLIIHRGKILVANRAVPTVIHATMYVTVNQQFYMSGSSLVVIPLVAPFVDSSNTVANVSNVAVYNVTTGQSINPYSDPADPTGPNLGATANWRQLGDTGITIIERGSQWNGTAWVPISPAPSGVFAPFISQGDVLKVTFDYIPPDDHVWVDFDSFSTLAAKLTAVGLLSRALSETNPYGGTLSNLEIYSSASWHLLDLSCPLVTFLTGGSSPLPAVIVGSTQSSTPKSLKLPWLVFAATTAVNNPTTQSLSYKNWAADANGNPVPGSTVAVVVNNAGGTLGTKSNVFLPTDGLAALEAWITSSSQAGGILTITNFQIVSTPFGHALLWDEIWPLNATFTGIRGYYTLTTGGNVRTLKVIYEQGIGLHVTRAAYLNESRYSGSYGYSNTDDPSAFENGVFPPVGGFNATPASARRYLFWHYARVDRQFQNPRWYQMLSADSPWMPASGWVNTKGMIYSDELSANEFNNVVSFYEATPLGVDTVGLPTVNAKTGISRMGTFSRAADIWSPFSYWLSKVTTLSYPNGASTGSISTSSGWYYANTSAVMSNATITQPIPSALPCQMEHFNAVGSLINGLPQFKWVPGNLSVNTSFTLNFAAANIIIVNGGDGYYVGESLPNNLKVSAISATGYYLLLDGVTQVPCGAITAVTQAGTAVVNTYDVYSTPQRPFPLDGFADASSSPSGALLYQVTSGDGIHTPNYFGYAQGKGALFDTSSGDGSTLNFIPTHANIGVPTVPTPPNTSGDDFHDRMVDTYYPRQAYFSWNGATPGGADPVGNYLAALTLSIQSGLPDGFGTALPIYEYDLHADGSVTSSRISSYAYGTNSAKWQASCAAYRWIKIDDARTLYNNLSLPFILNELVVPYSWQVFNVTGSNNQITTTTNLTSLNLINLGYSAPYGTTPNPPATPPPPANNGGGDLGAVNQIQADWFNDANGNWVRAYRSENICSSSSPIAGPQRFWLAQISYDVQQAANYNYSITGVHNYSFPYTPWYASGNYTSTTVESKTTFAIPGPFAPAGILTITTTWPVPSTSQVKVDYPQKLSYGLTAVLARYEGVADKCVACLPQNVGYYDAAWVATELSVFNTLGTQVVPIIADNSIESSLADVAYISGVGGFGQYETIISTGLLNARLVTVSVDGQNQTTQPPPGGGI